MAQYKCVPYEMVEHTELDRKCYLDYEQTMDSPDEAEIESAWIAQREKLYQVLDKLTPRQREVYILRAGYELSEKEIAKKLDIVQQVVSRHYIAACNKIEKLIVK